MAKLCTQLTAPKHTHREMKTEIALLGWQRWRRKVAPPGRAHRVATWKLVNREDSQFHSHMVTRVRWRRTPTVICVTTAFSGKEMWCPAGGSLGCTVWGSGHWYVYLHGLKYPHTSHCSAQMRTGRAPGMMCGHKMKELN